MNFYAVFALLMVFAVAWFGLDVGKMREHEIEASQGRGFDGDNDQKQAHDLNEEPDIEESENGSVSDLFVMPIVSLIVATVAAMLYTVHQALAADGQAFNLLGAFENTDAGKSLVYGGVLGSLCCTSDSLLAKAG